MSRPLYSSVGLALPAMLLSTAAWADVTPAQVWEDWRAYMDGMGYTITADESETGGDLTISDLTIDVPMPENDGSVEVTLDTMEFRQNADGTVAVVMPENTPMTFDVKGTGDDPDFTMGLTFTQTGHTTTVSGGENDMTTDYRADAFGLKLENLTVDGETYDSDTARFSMEASDVAMTTRMTVADIRDYTQSAKIGNITYDLFVKSPEEQGELTMNGGVSDLTADGTGAIPLDMADPADAANTSAMLKAGFAVVGTLTAGAGNTNIEFKNPQDGDFSAQSSSEGGELKVEMGEDGLTYAGAQTGIEVSANVADLPFPIELTMERGAFNVELPSVSSEETQDFALGMTMADFTMSDMIWGIFDPNKQLPRDPATIDLDLSGKAKLLIDYMDPDAVSDMETAPGEVQALTLNTLVVDAIGARLEGQGDVEFDNTDMETYPGMPKPVGDVNLSLVGGNALLDKLVAMGFLPQDQAMGARMMMGLFAVPGSEEDTLTSKIEFTEDGQISANGQRIK